MEQHLVPIIRIKMKECFKQVLWAINEKCPFNCKYCYLSFDNGHNPLVKDNYRNCDTILKFLSNSLIKTVFLAGAEPLLNTNLVNIIKTLKSFNKQVVLCTNGIIKNEKLWKEILLTNLDAISFSLDSYNKVYNDSIRVQNSWQSVVNNILNVKSIIDQAELKTKIGVYTVITKQNIFDLFKTYEFCSKELNIDYYIYQPITLPPQHPMYSQLVIKEENLQELEKQINKINCLKTNTFTPNKDYINLMFKGIKRENIKQCFINNNFIFIMPNGMYCQCPCFCEKREIRSLKETDNVNFNQLSQCNCFSEECSNIYQLLTFKEILNDR